MKNIAVIIALTAAFLAQPPAARTASEKDDYYYKINKSFEIYGAVFRELAKNYVLEIDPDYLLKKGIKGMLSGLDPYTSYYEYTRGEDFGDLTSGSYVGLGIQVGVYDSMLTITGVAEGYSAFENGVRIGDKLYRIDSVVILHELPGKIRKYTSGKAGTFAELHLLRNGLSDTLKILVERKEIRIKNVSYYGMYEGGIAYINLERFSKLAPLEVKKALSELKDSNEVKGIILDLRGNPGGLLESAVGVAELFLRGGKEIVSTKGRFQGDNYVYRASKSINDTTTPLAVLIDGASASASEVVAGAVQDHDRGIIVGSRSYGKGLVQSVIGLPHKSNIKITTAKYYTPSGRCIQRIDYFTKNGEHEVKEASTDSVFSTQNGRIVYESKGIKPDSAITDEKDYSGYTNKLYAENLFFEFANIFAAKRDSLPEGFTAGSDVLKEFKNYIDSKGFEYKSEIDNSINKIKEYASTEGISNRTKQLINKLEKNLSDEIPSQFDENRKDIAELLEFEILMRFQGESRIREMMVKKSRVVKTASNLLKSGEYRRILSPH